MIEQTGPSPRPGPLDVAERYGLIGDIDRWVIQLISRSPGAPPVQVNVSAHSISDSSIRDHIERCIDSPVPTRRDVFEITRRATPNQEEAVAFARHLHELGCKVALDDFGTGYGSFTSKHFPVDYLKIDMEFVLDLTASQDPARRGGRRLDRPRVLRQDGRGGRRGRRDAGAATDLGVDFAQGFYVSPPMPLFGGERTIPGGGGETS